ncbi:aldehyde dehydrogenase [Metabacillus idriensis]|uniref:aldehyde dehydrogenase n=1 Tax=Metabacillus idriensis TaxID=324768 RepID=UPI00203C89AA|nr:aldehyde dehydrogenase [Metabacillus idriensis]MCM3598803.1 aldehyde dehydrogenase [Metabacillus idriensis]
MTAQEQIQALLFNQRAYFLSGNTRSVQGRYDQLGKLSLAIKKKERAIMDALNKDLNKSEFEAYSTEIGILLEEISFSQKNLKKWAAPKKVKTAMTHIGTTGKIVPEPFGTALIIAPWNYPFQLAISPLVGAIAAGNTAVLKPSEFAPNVSSLLKDLVEEIFPSELVAVVEGGIETNQLLLDQKFDTIFFTGSVPVGKIVMEAASKHLTPVTLELGGKSPCIVHKDADLKLSAKRIAFGKFTNAGQTCIAPDYLLVHSDVKKEFLSLLQAEITEMFSENPLLNENYSRMISEKHFERLTEFFSDGKAILGGTADRNSLKIAPTILDEVKADAAVMQEEIFGPILPVMEYADLDEAITFIQARPKPLALYLFTASKQTEQQIIGQVSFGGGCINDTLMHIATPHLPFGGVGESGMGNYHGKYSFEAFSHYKSVLHQTTKFDFSFRYPNAKNGLKLIRRLLK